MEYSSKRCRWMANSATPGLGLHCFLGLICQITYDNDCYFFFRCKISETVPLDIVPDMLSKLEDVRVGKAVMVVPR